MENTGLELKNLYYPHPLAAEPASKRRGVDAAIRSLAIVRSSSLRSRSRSCNAIRKTPNRLRGLILDMCLPIAA